MNGIYPVLIFLHVLGAMGVFVALGVETVAMERLRLTDKTGAAMTWVDVLRGTGRLGPIAMITTLGAGVWMMVVRWGHQPWISLGLVGLVAMALLGGLITRRRLRQVRERLASEDAIVLTPGFRSLVNGRALALSLHLRNALGVGILALMTIKPGTVGALGMMAAALVAGLGVRAPLVALIGGSAADVSEEGI